MRSLRLLILLTAACLAVASVSCGRKGRPAGHAAESAVPAAVPTPDTTPVDVLRTPAGLVLKTNTTPSAASPAPEVTPARTTQ